MEFLLTRRVREGHARLAKAVRGGGTALGEATLEPENPDWVKFAEAMMSLMHGPSEIMATELRKGGEAHKVLDIAASHGTLEVPSVDWSTERLGFQVRRGMLQNGKQFIRRFRRSHFRLGNKLSCRDLLAVQAFVRVAVRSKR